MRRPTTAGARAGPRRRLALADWNGSRSPRGERGRRQAARRGLASFLEWTVAWHSKSASPSVSQPTVSSRFSPPRKRWGRASRPATCSSRSRVSGWSPTHPHRAGRQPTAQRVSAARLAPAVHGGSAVRVASERSVTPRSSSPGEALEVASADVDTAKAALRLSARCRHRLCCRLAARQPEQRHLCRIDQHGRFRPSLL